MKTSFLKTRLSIIAIVLSAFPIANASSEDSHNAPLAAHEHGHGTMMMAQDGNELLIELHLPGADVVGFEHHPENHDQEHAVEMVIKNLKNASKWLHLTESANCRIEEAHVSSPLAGREEEHKDEAHEETHKDHADDQASGNHAEFTAEYHVNCEAPGHLDGVDIGLFKVFPSLEEIDFQAVVSKGQYGGELNATQSSVRF